MNSFPWFRLYTDLLNDPKVQTLSDAHFRAYINTLCIASTHNPRGELPPLKDYAFAIHRTEQQASKTLASLLAAGLLEGCLEGGSGVARVKNWALQQFESDTSSQRVQRHRSNVKRFKTVSVTAPETDPDTDPDTDTERSKKRERECTLYGSGSGPVSLSASLEISFTPLTEERFQQAKEKGFTDREWVEKETAKFVLKHGHDIPRYKSPVDSWLLWLTRGKEYADRNPKVVPIARAEPRRRPMFGEG